MSVAVDRILGNSYYDYQRALELFDTYRDENGWDGHNFDTHETISNNNDYLPRPMSLVSNGSDLLMLATLKNQGNEDSQSFQPSKCTHKAPELSTSFPLLSRPCSSP